MVITQESAQSLAALNRPVAADVRTPREQQDIALPLVIPLGMEMFDIFAQCSPQGALSPTIVADVKRFSHQIKRTKFSAHTPNRGAFQVHRMCSRLTVGKDEMDAMLIGAPFGLGVSCVRHKL
jgi:hypothetical protein